MNQYESWRKDSERFRKEYPVGTRILLNRMNDPYNPVQEGMRGTVESVDDGGNIHMKWDNGRTLALCSADDFRKLTQEEIEQEIKEQSNDEQIREQTM